MSQGPDLLFFFLFQFPLLPEGLLEGFLHLMEGSQDFVYLLYVRMFPLKGQILPLHSGGSLRQDLKPPVHISSKAAGHTDRQYNYDQHESPQKHKLCIGENLPQGRGDKFCHHLVPDHGCAAVFLFNSLPETSIQTGRLLCTCLPPHFFSLLCRDISVQPGAVLPVHPVDTCIRKQLLFHLSPCPDGIRSLHDPGLFIGRDPDHPQAHQDKVGKKDDDACSHCQQGV